MRTRESEREREREGTRCVRVIRKERIKDQRERAREGARTKAKANEVGSNNIFPRESLVNNKRARG